MSENPLDPKGPHQGGPFRPESFVRSPFASKGGLKPKASTFTKVFRWRLPDGHTAEPNTVEVTGSFTQWQKVPMTRDGAVDSWHVTIHNIPGHRTHHYMFLVDGQPAADRHCDGMAVPTNEQERQYQLMTDRGPRVFMLFAQAK